MSGAAGFWEERGKSEMEVSRFLEYSEATVREELLPLTPKVMETLASLPALFAYEFDSNASRRARDEPSFARLGRIVEVRHRQRALHFRYEFVQACAAIPMEKLVELVWDLDIDMGGNENYRTHWAVKNVDLLAVLKVLGFLVETHPVAPEIADQLRSLHTTDPTLSIVKPKVFVVHGRDDGMKNEVGRWLARIGLDDVILHEQANLGRTLIAKFRDISKEVVFAIVIMTPDDVGGLAGGTTAYRARQNVIFELGYFLGVLGGERVAALVVGDVEKPSDYDGVVYIPYDKPGGWKLQLAREFVSLKIPFDSRKAF